MERKISRRKFLKRIGSAGGALATGIGVKELWAWIKPEIYSETYALNKSDLSFLKEKTHIPERVYAIVEKEQGTLDTEIYLATKDEKGKMRPCFTWGVDKRSNGEINLAYSRIEHLQEAYNLVRNQIRVNE